MLQAGRCYHIMTGEKRGDTMAATFWTNVKTNGFMRKGDLSKLLYIVCVQ